MHSIVRQCIAGVALALSVGAAWAETRALPELDLAHAGGAVVARGELSMNQTWVMVVVDASLELSSRSLTLLEQKDRSWENALTIVVIGNQAALVALQKKHEKLAGARWMRSTAPDLAEKLALTGTPTFLGIDENEQIAWQRPATPEKAARLQFMLNGWLTPQARPSL
ncbi:hypothetical protein [Massilia scottii]|uniref:hypothetical protein n=1 Tax=Massilia scottii TaxID=3057166 RepID=UPI002796B5BC|nr:hypothetical protein [Massilia sp. CCM 9029]MDQ1832629.1 hypothetical protein [Massilia sp. CCM 9029]